MIQPGDLVFAYYRDSGGAQQELSIGQQRERVGAWAAEQGAQIVGEYVDERLPGSTDNRAAFQALLAACCVALPPVRAVLVWDFSRFSRDETDRAYFPALLAKHGVQVLSVTQPATDGPTAHIMASVLAFSDGEYLRSLSRNVKRGLATASRLGRTNGPRPPVGYTRTVITLGAHRDGTPRTVQRWQVDAATAPAVCEAFALYAAGATVAEIHRRLHLHRAHASYSDMWDNPLYAGVVRSGDHTHQDEALRIIDDATWQAAQRRRAQRLPARRRGSRYLLSGLLLCGQCGRPMNGVTDARKKQTYRYYTCYGQPWRQAPCALRCRAEAVETTILALTTAQLAEHTEALLAALQAATADTGARARLTAELAQAETALKTLLDLAETGTVALPELRQRVARREAVIAELRAQLAQTPQRPAWDEARVRAALARLAGDLTAPDVAVRRRALAAVIARAVLQGDGSLDVYWQEPVVVSAGTPGPARA